VFSYGCQVSLNVIQTRKQLFHDSKVKVNRFYSAKTNIFIAINNTYEKNTTHMVNINGIMVI